MRSDRAPAGPAGEAGRRPGPAETAAKLAVLVVDDEALIRDVVQAALEEDGYEVVAADSGRAAISILEAHGADYRILVTDVALGQGSNGWDVARRARELYPDVAVVYISGAHLNDYASQGVANSIVVDKPFGVAQIQAEVAGLIGA
jgi:CheY-like chemotaxis protein